MGNKLFISVAGLKKSYDGVSAVASFDLDLKVGEIFGLLGANGGGKTTTLRMFAGLITPDAGSGFVLGHDLFVGSKKSFAAMRHSIGYMAQKHSLYTTLTVAENLKFRADIYGVPNPSNAVASIIEKFELTPYASKRAGTLSGGWARRLQLAAALIHGPKLLLLDEPTAGLDARAKAAVWNDIALLAAADTAIIVSTHDLSEAKRTTRSSFLQNGHIVASGTADEIILQANAVRLSLTGDGNQKHLASLRKMHGVFGITPETNGIGLTIHTCALSGITAFANENSLSLKVHKATLEDAALLLGNPENESGASNV